ncbi:hypothetical protein [Flavobacterium koreense]
MKKTLLLLLLMPLLASAKFYKAKITFNDGKIKNGFLELPDYYDNPKIKFKEEEKGKIEKIGIEEVSGFEITNDKNDVIKYVTLKLAEQNSFNLKKIKPGDKKIWARIIVEGKISIYAGYVAYEPSNRSGGGGIYYIKRQNEDYALYLDEFGGDGLSVCMNCFTSLKKTLKLYFDETCPQFSELLNKDELKKNGVKHIVDLYEQNCGK